VEFLEAAEISSKIHHLSLSFTNIRIGMAYIKKKGFHSFANSLNLTSSRSLSRTKFQIQLLVGLSERQYITDYEPLQKLMMVKKGLEKHPERLQIRYYNDTRFHPKMFILTNKRSAVLLVGSSNLTQGGLERNKEANLLLEAEGSHAAIQNAVDFFDRLWDKADLLTQHRLKTYAQDKDKHDKTKSKPVQGRLPKSRMPSHPIPKKDDLRLIVEGNEYQLGRIHSYCTECGRPTAIPPKWLTYWRCEKHGQSHYILKRKRKTRINIEYSGRQIKDVKRIEGTCLQKGKDGVACGLRFSLESDLSHQICRQCYERRRIKKQPCSRIPRTREIDESFFYDVRKDVILARSRSAHHTLSRAL